MYFFFKKQAEIQSNYVNPMLIRLPVYHITTSSVAMTQPGDLFSSVTFVRWLIKCTQLYEI